MDEGKQHQAVASSAIGGANVAEEGGAVGGLIATQLELAVETLRFLISAAVVEVIFQSPLRRNGWAHVRWAAPATRPSFVDAFHETALAHVTSGPVEHQTIHRDPIGGWHSVLVPIVADDHVVGLVAVGYTLSDPSSSGEHTAIRSFATLCGSVLQRVDRDRPGHQHRLDELVTAVAAELMAATSSSLDAIISWTLRTLQEFLEVDTVFLRRNDHERGVTILVDEWPRRQNVPDPDPLGVVPFDAEPAFAITRTLRDPFIVRPRPGGDRYQERVQEAAGVAAVSAATVPLLRGAETVGVLGFVKFGDRVWTQDEVNALRAIASLVVQLQARVEAEERLHYSAFHDELTGLANRRALLDELDRRLVRSPFTAVLFLDLDGFKSVNDHLGHAAGDRLLVRIANRISGALRGGDVAARLGGDEFVVVLADGADLLEATAVANRILEVIAQPLDFEGHHIVRTTSIGVAFASTGQLSAEDLLGQADKALYTAKARGRNCAVVFDEALRSILDERSSTELQLREVIDQGGLQLHYHPELDLRTGQLLACEALVRWDHPIRGLLPAGAFIEIAEETGLIVDLGRWVLGEGCRQMADWVHQYPDIDFTMRINVSPAQLVTTEIVELVAHYLDLYDLPGRRLCLEITEHAVVQDIEGAQSRLQSLRELGVSLAIDDFGTGFSSIAQLKTLPVDVIKIDRSFVSGLGTNATDKAIIESIVRLAEAFDLELVAEGVETATHVEELLKLGCYRSQGFLLCKPLPGHKLDAILKQGGIHLAQSLTVAA